MTLPTCVSTVQPRAVQILTYSGSGTRFRQPLVDQCLETQRGWPDTHTTTASNLPERGTRSTCRQWRCVFFLAARPECLPLEPDSPMALDGGAARVASSASLSDYEEESTCSYRANGPPSCVVSIPNSHQTAPSIPAFTGFLAGQSMSAPSPFQDSAWVPAELGGID